MTNLNPLLQRLREDINDRNQLISTLISNVEKKQTMITIFVVAINVMVWWIMDTYVEHKILNLGVTIISMAISIPSAMRFASSKKTFEDVMVKDIKPSPDVDYSGYWMYRTTFDVVPNEKDPIVTEYHDILMKAFHKVTEQGVCQITQNMYEMKIHFASGEVNQHARVKWNSDPIFYDKNQVRWLFIGEVVWTDDRCRLSSEFKGIEEYDVCGKDDQGRPIRMVGRLLGCIQSVEQYILKAKSEFVRISPEEYHQRLNNIW